MASVPPLEAVVNAFLPPKLQRLQYFPEVDLHGTTSQSLAFARKETLFSHFFKPLRVFEQPVVVKVRHHTSGRELTIIGTSHISRDEGLAVAQAIRAAKPDLVAIEYPSGPSPPPTFSAPPKGPSATPVNFNDHDGSFLQHLARLPIHNVGQKANTESAKVHPLLRDPRLKFPSKLSQRDFVVREIFRVTTTPLEEATAFTSYLRVSLGSEVKAAARQALHSHLPIRAIDLPTHETLKILEEATSGPYKGSTQKVDVPQINVILDPARITPALRTRLLLYLSLTSRTIWELVYKRDAYMVKQLEELPSHVQSVAVVVGRDHVDGIASRWKSRHESHWRVAGQNLSNIKRLLEQIRGKIALPSPNDVSDVVYKTGTTFTLLIALSTLLFGVPLKRMMHQHYTRATSRHMYWSVMFVVCSPPFAFLAHCVATFQLLFKKSVRRTLNWFFIAADHTASIENQAYRSIMAKRKKK